MDLLAANLPALAFFSDVYDVGNQPPNLTRASYSSTIVPTISAPIGNKSRRLWWHCCVLRPHAPRTAGDCTT
jgi:hypothetical protein